MSVRSSLSSSELILTPYVIHLSIEECRCLALELHCYPRLLDLVLIHVCHPVLLQVTAESKFVDLGADSLDTVEIMMALEEKFDLQLDEEGAEKISTVQEAADLIAEQIN